MTKKLSTIVWYCYGYGFKV